MSASSRLRNVWQKLSSTPMRYPFAFGVGISTAKTSFSDLLVQKVVEKRERIDWKRNAAFATFGFFYLGGVQYALYVPIFGRMFPNAASFAAKPLRKKLKDAKGMFALISQVLIDQCFHHPFFYFPAFYATKEIVISDKPNFTNALAQYRENMMEDLQALWKIWIPATLFNFAFMPMWARIPCVAATSLLWTCILSAMRGGDVIHSEDMAGGSVRGASFTLMKEGLGELFASPVDLDPNMCHICVSAAGPDRVGWVSTVARAVADKGGNVSHSKMVRLGNDFIILMHVSVPPEKLSELNASLNKDEKLQPLNIRTSSLRRRDTNKYEKASMGLRVHCVGEDRPGMLAAIADRVSKENLLIENITTKIVIGSSGRRDFVIDCDCTSSRKLEKSDLDVLFEDFSILKEDMKFDVLDIRVQVY
mmetsp:Transcript_13690/g.19576  ORF Transcript_13690/g.19576 Transcript_13690/m.19576 type:complete len:420 (+) Transcript_13690:67-1326(+)